MTCEKSKGTLTVMKDNKDEEIKYDVYILQKPSDKCKKKKRKNEYILLSRWNSLLKFRVSFWIGEGDCHFYKMVAALSAPL